MDTGSQVCNLAWSKSSSELVSTHGYYQNQIIIWRYPSLMQVAKLTGHTTRVLFLVSGWEWQQDIVVVLNTRSVGSLCVLRLCLQMVRPLSQGPGTKHFASGMFSPSPNCLRSGWLHVEEHMGIVSEGMSFLQDVNSFTDLISFVRWLGYQGIYQCCDFWWLLMWLFI